MGTVDIVYHLTSQEADSYCGRRYIKLETERLHYSNPDPLPVPRLRLEQVRVVITAGLKQQVIMYNPTTQLKDHETAWIFGTVPIINLLWDPIDW